jgi:hypothetical protein
MTTGLLGDTPFLDLLQDYTVKFNNRVETNPFGNYTPMQASDFINTPFGQPIAQNPFEGNQFLMPDLSGSTYTPGNFSLAPGAGFNFGNMGTYNPGAFNQFYQAPMTSPAIARTTTRTGGGGNFRDNMGPNVSTEFVGDRGFRIIDGQVTELDPNSLDYKLNSFFKGLLSSTPGAMLLGALGQDMTTPDIARIRRESGDEAANLIAGALGEQGREELQEAMKTEAAQKAEAQRVSNRLAEVERIRQSRQGEGQEKQRERDRKSREGRADRGFSRDSTGRKNY